ncbi:hypothetical protein CAOG_03326 [Capsaspora owczarzaki ATCC 30864]|uniref:Uncharacterized protein n=1 Tax=Capsaspora owczarzaki (strain ATCC 30864) TaxID=595528 RepID=A0A0D2WMX1_CAPO3|nr:hypothetical protein CAOG_03326 [Capsaspora owczarzaki ATCC 30864]KJE92340.1 hypothetical protein CAOG_003326 [Capsaspora owczarzaki ATCC 30864]|eukprot:XP_004364165.1 hypothetical protein CAOG_03326 [Capsaspora owczarzaki ATCC 30864]
MLFSLIAFLGLIAGLLYLATGARPLKWWRPDTLVAHDLRTLPYMLSYPFEAPDSRQNIIFDSASAAASSPSSTTPAPATQNSAGAAAAAAGGVATPPNTPPSASRAGSHAQLVSTPSSASIGTELPGIRAASLDKLVQRLTHHSISDANFAANFLMTYRAFSTPAELLEKLIHRYHVPLTPSSGRGAATYDKDFVHPIQVRVCNVVKLWVKTGYRDFVNNPTLIARLKYFVALMRRTGHEALADAVIKSFDKQAAKFAADEAAAARLAAGQVVSPASGPSSPASSQPGTPRPGTPVAGLPASAPSTPAHGSLATAVAASPAAPTSATSSPAILKTPVSRAMNAHIPSRSPSKEEIIASPIPMMPPSDLVADITSFLNKKQGSATDRMSRYTAMLCSDSLDALEIARQITLVDYELFRAVEPVECLEQAWSKKDKLTRAPNVLAFIKRFNDLSLLVVSCIVLTPDIKARALVLRKFMLIAQALRELQNFNSLVSIVAAMNSSPIHRLRKTMELVPEKVRQQFKAIEDLVGASSNYKQYRTRLHNLDPPCIPYIGVYLSDLTFIEDGNSSKVEGLTNFDKYRRVASVVREIMQYQDTRYNLVAIPAVIKLFSPDVSDELGINEDKAYENSLLCEPRAAS